MLSDPPSPPPPPVSFVLSPKKQHCINTSHQLSEQGIHRHSPKCQITGLFSTPRKDMAQPPSSKGANHSTQTSTQKIVKPLQVSCVGQIPVLRALHIVITRFDSADIIPNSGGFVGLSSTEWKEFPPYFIPQSVIPTKFPNPTASLTIQRTGHPHHEALCDSPARSPPSHLWSPVCSFPRRCISPDCCVIIP